MLSLLSRRHLEKVTSPELFSKEMGGTWLESSVEGISSGWTLGPLNQSQLKSECPLAEPQFPQTTPGYSLLLTLEAQHRWSLQVALNFPGAVQDSRGADAVALQWARAACGGAEGRESHNQVLGPKHTGLWMCPLLLRGGAKLEPRAWHVLGWRGASPEPLPILLHPVVAQSPTPYKPQAGHSASLSPWGRVPSSSGSSSSSSNGVRSATRDPTMTPRDNRNRQAPGSAA